MRVTIGLAQIHPKFGDVDANVRRHIELMQQAANDGIELLVFPELSLTGYYLRDLVQPLAMTVDDEPMQAIRAASRELDIDVVVGFVDLSGRGNYHIAAAYIQQGDVRHVHHKCYLPTYGQFDDMRYFEPGNAIMAFDTRFGRVGMLICEDFWHVSASYLLWLDGADLMIFHSASPGRGLDEHESLGTERNVNNYLQTYATLYTTHIVHCNRVGFENGENFWGASAIVDPSGNQVLRGPRFEELLLRETIDLAQAERSRRAVATLRDERLTLTLQQLQRIMSNSNVGSR